MNGEISQPVVGGPAAQKGSEQLAFDERDLRVNQTVDVQFAATSKGKVFCRVHKQFWMRSEFRAALLREIELIDKATAPWVKKLRGRDVQIPASWFVRKTVNYTLSACELNYPMQFFAASMNVQRI
jgi:hypothetical protein